VPEGALVFVRAVQLGRDGEEFAEAYGLTTAERAIARLLAKRLTNKEIADELGVSPHTVKHHVERILHKLGVSSRKEVRGVLRDGRR
jgi:DNA-binding CsgD family transcriptional regulator